MLFRNNYRNCGRTHLRAYPGCYEECNRDICDFVPQVTPPTVFDGSDFKQHTISLGLNDAKDVETVDIESLLLTDEEIEATAKKAFSEDSLLKYFVESRRHWEDLTPFILKAQIAKVLSLQKLSLEGK